MNPDKPLPRVIFVGDKPSAGLAAQQLLALGLDPSGPVESMGIGGFTSDQIFERLKDALVPGKVPIGATFWVKSIEEHNNPRCRPLLDDVLIVDTTPSHFPNQPGALSHVEIAQLPLGNGRRYLSSDTGPQEPTFATSALERLKTMPVGASVGDFDFKPKGKLVKGPQGSIKWPSVRKVAGNPARRK